MIVWDVLNSLFRIAIMAIIVWKLYRFSHLFNPFERWGMGIAGGCSLLTITVIWDAQRSPFDGWATSLFSLGVLLYFLGRSSRHWRHERNNAAMIGGGRHERH